MTSSYEYDVHEVQEQLKVERDPVEKQRLNELLRTLIYEHQHEVHDSVKS